MLYIVDGTGDGDETTYRRNMSGGMCEKMAKRFNGHYYRGPTLLGLETYVIAEKVYSAIKADPAFRREPLFLAGHSRGGAAVIRVAQLLRQDKVNVEAMFLFDAVDRTADSKIDVQIVPGNVTLVFHARRSKRIVNYFEEGSRYKMSSSDSIQEIEQNKKMALKYNRLDNAMKVRMRFSTGYYAGVSTKMADGIGANFENCGVGYEGNTKNYKEEFFLGSHGAIGGSYIGDQDGEWKDPADRQFFQQILDADRAAVSSVSAWMDDNFAQAKLSQHKGVRTEMRRP